MLHFFRKIRRELLAESKFFRYLKYGIGEIILVVIGILIAIQLDNWNEDRIAAENTKILFQEVSDELAMNIENIDRILDLYLKKDSIYFKVLNKKVEYEDYKTNDELFTFLLEWDRTSLVDDDFKTLLTGKNNLTKLQDSIFLELKDLYGKRKTNVDRNDQMVVDVHLDFRDKLLNEQPWWSRFSLCFCLDEENSNDIIQYALSDPFYLNQIGDIRLREGGHYHGMLWFRTKALVLYKAITDMLSLENDSTLVKDVTDFKRLKGVYKMGERKVDIIGEDELKFRWFRPDSTVSSVWDIHPYSNSYLILFRQDLQEKGANMMFRIVNGENEKVLGLILIQDMNEKENGGRRMWKK